MRDIIRISLAYVYPRHRRRFCGLLALTSFCAVIDVACFTSVIPVIYLINDPRPITNNPILFQLYSLLGFQSNVYFILFLLFGLVFVFLFKNSLLLYSTYLQNNFIFSVAYEITGDQADRLFASDWLDIRGSNSQEFVRYMANAPQKYANTILHSLLMLFYEAVVVFLVASALLVFYPMVLFLVCLAVLPLSYYLVRAAKGRISRISDRKGKIEVDSYQHTHEIIRGYQDIKLFGKETVFKSDLMGHFDVLYRLNAELYIYQQMPRRIIEVVVIFAVALLYTVAAVILGTNAYALVLVLVTFATATYRLMPSVNEILFLLVQLRSTKYILDQLNVLEPVDPGSTHDPLPFLDRLSLDSVTYSYTGSEPVLKAVSLLMNKGDFVVVTGESGSGKSTLGKVIAGFLHPQLGVYKVDGIPVVHLNQVRKLIGYVTQDFFLFDRTLMENIAVGEKPEEVDMERLQAVIRASRLTEFIDTSPQGLHYPVGEMGARLSGGQKQRLAIARALYKQAQILVLDEITSALDIQNETEVLNSIYDIAKANGLTVLLITHRITSLARYDKHVQIRNGILEIISDNCNN